MTLAVEPGEAEPEEGAAAGRAGVFDAGADFAAAGVAAAGFSFWAIPGHAVKARHRTAATLLFQNIRGQYT